MVCAAVLAAAAAAGGLFLAGVYFDNTFTASGWWGTDIVTLLVALPVALAVARRRSVRSSLITLGLLAYLFYNAAFYAFGARLNDLFLLYVATMSLALLGLILALRSVTTEGWTGRFPQRFCGGFLVFVGAALAVVEIGQSIAYVATGDLPDVVVNTAHPTHVVAALDLVFVVPFLLLGGVLLLKRSAWGFVIGIAIAIKGAIYMIGLSLTTLLVASAGFPDAGAQIPIWVGIGVGSAITAAVLLTHIEPSSAESEVGASRQNVRAA
jgi:hypothetical protein